MNEPVNEYQEKIRTIGVSLRRGTSRSKPVIREEGPGAGEIGGYEVEHWDDSQDAHVITPPLKVKAQPQEGV